MRRFDNRPRSLDPALVKSKLTNCTEMLLRTQNLDATDPRDKIFAVHGLLSVLGARLPDPDYSKPIEQVYREAAAAAITHDKRLQILASVTGESMVSGLPSWVPDWSCNLPITEIASWDDYLVPLKSMKEFRISADRRFLTLWGSDVDEICENSKAFPGRDSWFDFRDTNTLRTRFEEMHHFIDQKRLVDFFSGFIEQPWARTKTSFNLSVRTLAKYWIKGIKHFTQYASEQDLPRYTAKDISYWASNCAKRDGLKRIGEDVKEDMLHFHNLMRTLLDRKRIFSTTEGHVGVASRAIRNGDRIAYFREVNLPMVIRPVTDIQQPGVLLRLPSGSTWQLIAPAYIQNGMLEPVQSDDLGIRCLHPG